MLFPLAIQNMQCSCTPSQPLHIISNFLNVREVVGSGTSVYSHCIFPHLILTIMERYPLYGLPPTFSTILFLAKQRADEKK